MLQQLLSRHPDIMIAPETHFMARFANPQRPFDLSSDEEWRRLLDSVVRTPEFADMLLDPDEFFESCWSGPRELQWVFRNWLNLFANLHGVGVVGEKTPNHQLHIAQLHEWYPAARFLQIVRDPRAVALSTRGLWWSRNSVRGDARVWRHYARTLQRTSMSGIAFSRVSYEELVGDPDTVMRRVYGNLSLDPDIKSVATSIAPSTIGINVDREPWKRNVDRRVSAAGAGAWRHQLTRAEIRDVEAVTWRWMRREHYNRTQSAVSLIPSIAREELFLLARLSLDLIRRGSRRFRGASLPYTNHKGDAAPDLMCY